jgi:FecR protein
MSDYLWEGTGKPDPDVERLGSALAPLRYRPGAFPVPLPDPVPRRRWPAVRVALAGGLAAALAAVVYLAARPGRGPAFAVTRLEGSPSIGARAIGEKGRLKEGDWLETDAASSAEIAVANIGKVEVSPASRIRLLRTGEREHRLELSLGEIHARIVAPPRLFVVDTPSAAAVDLGCEYTLSVAANGGSRLHVLFGEVELAGAGLLTKVPAGGIADTHPGIGPGLPVRDDAPEPLRRAVSAFDRKPDDPSALSAILEAAGADDGMTLWNLLPRVPETARSLVFAHLAAVSPPPAGVTEEGVLRLDRSQLAAWWDSITD